MGILDYFFGGGGSTNIPASIPSQYPTNADAQFAKQQDYSYGQPWASEFNDQIYRVLIGDPNAKALSSATIPGDKLKSYLQKKSSSPGAPPELTQNPLQDYYARAALASQNSGLALLGFNPSKSSIDVTRSPANVNMLGFYAPKNDELYANALRADPIVHESIHRGIELLSHQPEWKPEFDTFKDSDNQEMLVRELMKQRMGAPEMHGAIADQQMSQAKTMFETGSNSSHNQQLLEAIDKAAADYLARKHPMGPR
jgi:hypothetical protein